MGLRAFWADLRRAFLSPQLPAKPKLEKPPKLRYLELMALVAHVTDLYPS